MPSLVVVTDFDFEDDSIERSLITGAGFDFQSFHALSEEEIVSAAPDASALIVQYGKVGMKVIDALPNLKIIARYGVGVDVIDVEYASKRGVQVTNVPADYCLNEVADHALAMMLTINRQLFSYDSAVRSGEWKWQSGAPIHRLAACTVGVVGFGRIGQAIVQRVQPFGSRVLISDPSFDTGHLDEFGVESVNLSRVIAESDYLILQAPLNDSTRNMISEAELALMKPGAVVINTARGPLIDTAALDRAIGAGHIRAAGLDDVPEEPAKQHNWKPRDPMFANSRAVLTPHAAYYSEESIEFCRNWASQEVIRMLSGEAVQAPVNHI